MLLDLLPLFVEAATTATLGGPVIQYRPQRPARPRRLDDEEALLLAALL